MRNICGSYIQTSSANIDETKLSWNLLKQRIKYRLYKIYWHVAQF